MLFKIHAERSKDDKKIFYYDNEKNILSSEDGVVFEDPNWRNYQQNKTPFIPFSKDLPLKKSNLVTRVKIQMGLSCNYSCEYCSQKFVERPPETSKKDIDNFMQMLSNLEFSEEKGLAFEFWGGEPFVYWKTMKPLAEAIQDKFADWKVKPRFSVITNGSILNRDICAWLYYMGFSVSISHDGPGQYVRGPDPFDDPDQKKILLDFYKIMKPLNRISFNAMCHNKNRSRKEIHEWFVKMLNDETVVHGEGGIVDAYDEDGVANSLTTKKDHFEYRQISFNDMYSTKGQINFFNINDKINGFTRSVLLHSEAQYLNQKCGMDREDTIAIDMKGNVMTCQNVSAIETGPNGESHFGGTIEDIENVELKAGTHWSNRDNCAKCPVLHICKGACLFLDGKFWDVSCNNAYSDTIPLFALSFERITGYIPTFIDNDELPDDRKDIWGTILEHKEEKKKKIIPIKVIAGNKTNIDGVDVYEKARIGEK